MNYKEKAVELLKEYGKNINSMLRYVPKIELRLNKNERILCMQLDKEKDRLCVLTITDATGYGAYTYYKPISEETFYQLLKKAIDEYETV